MPQTQMDQREYSSLANPRNEISVSYQAFNTDVKLATIDQHLRDLNSLLPPMSRFRCSVDIFNLLFGNFLSYGGAISSNQEFLTATADRARPTKYDSKNSLRTPIPVIKTSTRHSTTSSTNLSHKSHPSPSIEPRPLL